MEYCSWYCRLHRDFMIEHSVLENDAICHDLVVLLTLTRIIKSVVTGQAPVTLELRNTPGKKTQTTQGGTRIYHSWRNSCVYQKHIKVKSGVRLRCARSIPAYTSHYSRLEKPTIPLATQERLPRIYYT